MRKNRLSKRKLILDALLAGRVLTPYSANELAETTDATRIIRYWREKFPIKDRRVAGEYYHLYWMDEDFLVDWWKPKNSTNRVENAV